MKKPGNRAEVLNEARRIVLEDGALSTNERKDLLQYISTMEEATQPLSAIRQQPGDERLSGSPSAGHALLMLLKQQADELDALKKLSLNLTSSLDLRTVLDAVVTEAMRLVKNARTAHIFMYVEEKLDFGAALDSNGVRNKPMATPRKEGLTYSVARGGETVVVENMTEHPLFKDTNWEWEGSIIGIPLKIKNTVVGVMNLSRSSVGGFSRSELRLLGLLADQAAVAISNASLHLLVSKQAYSDTLTSLPNRRALDERLEQEVLSARRTGFPFAVVMMDLDGFKAINDSYGHVFGDQVLRSLFNYLATGLRSSDFLARYGGDELTLILSQTDLPPARLVTEKVLEKLQHFKFPVEGGPEMNLGLSGGIALYPVHAINGPDLLRAADEALYRAKKSQRGGFVVARGFTGPLNQPDQRPTD
jgi:diguanylate cyclase (GGDEF)-like protein